MTGETLIWLELAVKLGIPLQRLMQETTSTEFLMWKKYLELDMHKTKVEHFYYAQIAAEIRRNGVKHPAKVRLKDFLLKFEDKTCSKKKLNKEEQTKRDKSFWKSVFRMK